MKKVIKIIAVIVFLLTVTFKAFEYRHHLSFIPNELNVYKILYRAEDVWGFGPSGNETGIIVYELSDEIAEGVQREGLAYLQNLPSNTGGGGRNWRGHYQNWAETPIHVTKHWTDYMSLKDDADYSKENPSILNYMNAYGFGIRISPEIKKLTDDAITKSGNYYAYGRIGIIIVIPAEKRVVYAYNG